MSGIYYFEVIVQAGYCDQIVYFSIDSFINYSVIVTI